MEHQKILNLWNEASDSNFLTRKWNIVNDQLNTNYDAGNELSITQKCENPTFMILIMHTFW